LEPRSRSQSNAVVMGPGFRQDDAGGGTPGITPPTAEAIHLRNPPTTSAGGISRFQISLW
ncbi:hypothetical protein, partial [Bradyrhizobium altum]|uniref:hypothetical protein n=1 Tax=Bradyrhizobium altum TaxID=1571202 RepID=UPI001E383C1F